MTWEIALVLLLLAATFAAFLWERIPPDVTAITLFVVLLLSGLLPEAKAFSVLANPAPLTVGAMFILSAALVKCGAIDRLAALLAHASGFHYFTLILIVMLGAGAISAFVNNTPVVVVFTPVLLTLARRTGQPASRFLMPLSFAAVLGGCCTLLGTSTNLVVSGIVRDRGQPPLEMFELAWIGLPIAVAGTFYVALLGRWLLPARESRSAHLAEDERRDYLTEVFVQEKSPAVGRTAAALGLTPANGITVLELVRDEVERVAGAPDLPLEAGDRLVLSCQPKGVARIRSLVGLDLGAEKGLGLAQIAAHEGALVEAIVSSNSALVGRTPREINFRERYRSVLLAVHRPGLQLQEAGDDTPLRFGDILLLMGTDQAIEALRGHPDLLLIDRPPLPARSQPRHLAIVLATIAGVVLAPTLGLLDIEVSALVGCVVIFLTGCLKPKDGYQAIEWNLLFLIYGMLALGLAMEETGTSTFLVDQTLALVRQFVPPEYKALVMLAAFYLIASVLTEVLSNNAVAALLTPLALSVGPSLGVDSRPFVIAVCIAASASFATPIGYQTNTYVYGVGGYKFADFVKFGTPLNVICFVIALYVIPAVWPF